MIKTAVKYNDKYNNNNNLDIVYDMMYISSLVSFCKQCDLKWVIALQEAENNNHYELKKKLQVCRKLQALIMFCHVFCHNCR